MAFASDTHQSRYRFSCGRVSLLRCFLNVLSSLRSSGSCVRARQLVALLLERLEQLAKLGELRQLDGLLADREVLLERVERVVRRGHVREDRHPVLHLGALHLDGRLQLLLRPHHRMGRHLAEVAREHRVAAALLDLLVRRRLRRRERVAHVAGRAFAGRDVELDLVLDELDVARARRGPGLAERGSLAVEVVVDRHVDGLRRLLDRRSGLRRSAALALAHDRGSLGDAM
jgi:hypothetical protein